VLHESRKQPTKAIFKTVMYRFFNIELELGGK
jgi:hypothetical protein